MCHQQLMVVTKHELVKHNIEVVNYIFLVGFLSKAVRNERNCHILKRILCLTFPMTELERYIIPEAINIVISIKIVCSNGYTD